MFSKLESGMSIPKLSNFPKRVTIELTNLCNLNCRMCPRHYMDYPGGFIAPSLFKNLVDEMRDNHSEVMVPFFRGESLLHTDFLNLMTYAKKKELAIQLATNATLITRKLSSSMIDLGLDFISISIDSINPVNYESIRRGSNLSKIVNAVETLINEREKRLSTKPVLQVSAVDTGMTDDVKKEFVDFWWNKVDRVRIYPEHTKQGKFGALSLDGVDQSERLPCHKPFTEMVVYWDGRAAACNHDWNRHEGLGDISREGLHGTWTSQPYERFRAEHLENRFKENNVCRDCDHWRQYYNQDGLIGELFE